MDFYSDKYEGVKRAFKKIMWFKQEPMPGFETDANEHKIHTCHSF